MTPVSFVQFRTGTPVSLPEGKELTYAEFKPTKLQDFYLRIIHELAVQDKLTRGQVDDWLKRLASKDAASGRAVRRELEAKRSASVGQASPAAKRSTPATPAKRRSRPEKVLLLTSRGDHKRAVIVAREYGLHPLPVPSQNLRPGQSPDAHTVRAVEEIASKLITTGNWKSSD